ncbi:MAG: ATP-binding cassette domain-containing protein [Bacteroidota bacterium]|jgi:ABC-type multidrug transport system ATPase subunit
MTQYKELDTILYVDKLCVGYDGKQILKDVNIIEKNIVREGHTSTGQVIAFIGRSGRGKSTLFKALTGLLKPTSGQVLITDLKTQDANDAKEISEGDMGFVDQKYTLFRHKTVEDICRYAMRKVNNSKAEKEDIITKYLEDWGLAEHRKKYSCELSGGQRQRTAIIEQILSSKHFMILDEPFSGLDVGNIEKVKVAFDRIKDDNEYNTIIFSTHDIKLAIELADSIYIIGFPEGVTDYSTVVKHYDLKAMGLAWTEYNDSHRAIYNDIKELLLKS